MLKPFVTTASNTSNHPTGMGEIAGIMCRAAPRSAELVLLHKYIPSGKKLYEKSSALTVSRPPQCRAFSRVVMDEKLILLSVHALSDWYTQDYPFDNAFGNV